MPWMDLDGWMGVEGIGIVFGRYWMDLDCFGMGEGDGGFEFLEVFDEETGCMSVTFPDGGMETNCPDGTGFFVDSGGMRIDRVFDELTGCVTETFPDGVPQTFCPDEELTSIN